MRWLLELAGVVLLAIVFVLWVGQLTKAKDGFVTVTAIVRQMEVKPIEGKVLRIEHQRDLLHVK